MNSKKMILISGLIGPIKSSNQSFTNTVKGYLDNNYKIYHFAFFSKNNEKYELKELLNNKNYTFFGISDFLSNLVNGNKKNKKKVSNYVSKLPSPNEQIIPETEVNKKQEIFFIFYNIFETIRLIILVPFLKPDIIYSYEIFSVIPGNIISKIFKKPLIKRFQGTFINKDNLNSKKTLFHKKAYKKDCLLNIMTNDGTKGDIVLKKIGFEDKKVLFLLNGLDDRMIKKSNIENIEKIKIELNLKDKDLVLGIFNRFYPFKRVDRAVYLLEELKKEINNPYLLIGGMGGPMERSIKNYVEKKGLKENVKFLGQIKYDDMKDYYDCCDILLILNDYANTGNQIIESAYLGKQTIAVDDGNNSKVLNYKNIHYINYDDFLISARNEVIKIYNSKIYNFCEINNNILSWKDRIQKEINIVEKNLKICNKKYNT